MSEIKVPFLGDGIDSAMVVSILVKPGDMLALDDTIAEIETDKATAPIPATVAGKIQSILIKEGDMIRQGTVVCKLEGATSQATVAEPASPPAVMSTITPVLIKPVQNTQVAMDYSQISPADISNNASVSTAPSILRMANLMGLDLSKVSGTGNGGRVLWEDVRQYMAWLQTAAYEPKTSPTAVQAVIKETKPLPDFSKYGPIRKEVADTMRLAIAKQMSLCWSEIPHVTQFHKADITDLMALRQKHKAAYEKKGAKLSVTVLLLKSVVSALKAYPEFNASYDAANKTVIYKAYYHIGIAVDTGTGLVVPVIRDVDKKTTEELCKELDIMAAKARDKKLSLEDMKGASFTISNLGGFGVGGFTPIVNHPELAILGVSAAENQAVWNGKSWDPRMMMSLSVSYDHRVIDGANGARFIQHISEDLKTYNTGRFKGELS